MRLFIYRDSAQGLRSVCSRPFDNVGLFLEQGVGDSAQSCKKLLALCRAVAEGQLTSWEGANRHFQIFLSAQQVLITHLAHEATHLSRIPLPRFIQTVKLWERAIAQHLDLPYQVGVGIAVDTTHLESLTAEPHEELKEVAQTALKQPAHKIRHFPLTHHDTAINTEWRRSA